MPPHPTTTQTTGGATQHTALREMTVHGTLDRAEFRTTSCELTNRILAPPRLQLSGSMRTKLAFEFRLVDLRRNHVTAHDQ